MSRQWLLLEVDGVLLCLAMLASVNRLSFSCLVINIFSENLLP